MNKKSFNVFWTQHLLQGEKKEEFIKHMRAARPILERVSLYIDRKIGDEVLPEADYDSASWAYKQADHNGYVRAMKEVQEFVNLNNQKDE